MGKIRWAIAGAIGLVALGVLARSHILDGLAGAWGVKADASTTSSTVTTAGMAGSKGTAQVLAAGGLTDWQYLGPNSVGGPTSYIGYDPNNANVLYTVSSLGDVFRSSDAGATWNFLSHVPLRGARLEIASGVAQTLYAYANRAQLRQGPDFPSISYYGTPLFKSTDGGSTWVELRPSLWNQVGWLGQITRFRTVPGNPNELWATTAYGVVKSADGGSTWSLVFSQGWLTQCSDLEFSSATSKMYAACKTPTWNVLELDSAGDWSQLTNYSGPDWREARLALSKSDPRVIYFATFGVSMTSGPARLTMVSRTGDTGQTWETKYDREQLTDPVSAAVPGDFDYECEQSNGISAEGEIDIAVDPADPNQLWVAGFEIFRSNNGGASFGRAREREHFVSEVSVPAVQGMFGVHRYTSIAFPPNYNGTTIQTMYAAGLMGIERTINAQAAAPASPTLSCVSKTASASAWEPRNNGYSATRLVHGDVNNAGEMVASGPDMAVGISDGSGPNSWARTAGSQVWVGQTSIDPVEGLGRFTVSWPYGSVQWQWSDAANNWQVNQTYFDNGSSPGYVLFNETDRYRSWSFSRYTRDPNDRMHLVSGGASGVFESRDGGYNWLLISPNIAVQSYGFRRDGRIIASTADGYVLTQNTVDGKTWQMRDLNGCLLEEGNSCTNTAVHFTEFVLSPNPSDQGIYATAEDWTKAKLWYSPDGLTWQALDRAGETGGLPDLVGSTTLAIDVDNPRYLYVGTFYGLYASEDNGQNWSRLETPFPLTPVSKLKFLKDASGARRLVAFTYGRGAWSVTVAPSTTFVDVPTYAWSYDYIRRLYAAGITNGCGGALAHYCPETLVSRDQMAVFLLRATHGSFYQPPAATGYFADVPVNHWAAGWIEQLRSEGITNGCALDPAQYCPSATVSREQMAVFLLRSKHGAAYQPPAATGMFDDVPTNYWAAPWIEQLSREGVTNGCSSSPVLYCPGNPVTREQMAVFLVRAFAL